MKCSLTKHHKNVVEIHSSVLNVLYAVVAMGFLNFERGVQSYVE